MSEQTSEGTKKPKRERAQLHAEWKSGGDGSLTRTFPVEDQRKASLLAGRMFSYALKSEMPMALRSDGKSLVVTVPASEETKGKKVDRKHRSFAGRVDRFMVQQTARSTPSAKGTTA